MEVVVLGPDRATAIVDLWDRCGLTRPWNDPISDLKAAWTNPTSTLLGFTDHDRVVGTVMAGFDGHRGWIYYLAVDPQHQSTGLGRELTAAAESWLKEHGAGKVQLMVRGSNTGVVKFYQSLGYVDQETVVLGKFLDPALQALRDSAGGR